MAPPIASARALVAELPLLERKCLAVLAASGPLSRTRLAERLREASVRHPPVQSPAPHGRSSPAGQAVTTTDLAPMCKRWLSRGLAAQIDPHGGEHYACEPAAAHAVLSDPGCRATLELLRRAWHAAPGRTQYDYGYDRVDRQVRLSRLALYLREPQEVVHAFAAAMQAFSDCPNGPHPREALVSPQAPADVLALMPDGMRIDYLLYTSERCLTLGHAPSASMLHAMLELAPESAPGLRPTAVMLAALAAEPIDPQILLALDGSSLACEARALAELVSGDFGAARAHTKRALELAAGKNGRKPARLSSPLAPLLLLVLATGDPAQVALARASYRVVASKRNAPAALGSVAALLGEHPPGLPDFRPGLGSQLQLVCFGLTRLFLEEPVAGPALKALGGLRATLERTGLRWLAAQAESIERALRTPPEAPSEAARARGSVLLELQRRQAPWERALATLESLQPASAGQAPVSGAQPNMPERRLVFAVELQARGSEPLGLQLDDIDDELLAVPTPRRWRSHQGQAPGAPEGVVEQALAIEPRLQVRRGQGFTIGRVLALRSFADSDAGADYLGAEDRAILARIGVRTNWHGREHYFSALAPLALVGHPRVFWQHDLTGPPVQVIARPPMLRVVHGQDGLVLRVEPHANEAGLGLMIDDQRRLVVSELSPAQVNVQRAALALPPIPPEGEDRLRQILGRMAALFSIQSEIGVDAAGECVEQVNAEPRCVVQLFRAEPGLRARVSAAPLGASGPGFRPGEGLANVIAEVDGRLVGCNRDLAAERRSRDELVRAIPALQRALGTDGLRLEQLEECLSLLHELAALGDAAIVCWPEGKPMTVVGEAELSRLRLSLTERGAWLQATGTLRVDEELVLDLLQALARRTASGSYIALGEDRYLALSVELAAQLGAVDAAATGTGRVKGGDGLRISPLALGFVSPWLSALRAAGGLALDTRTRAQLDRVERAFSNTPELPRTLDAELRPYQRAGYEFLARLAEVGAGACLADDMGLGKTVMALALLLARAPSGPALVVAPTSVRANWFDEALRFAPALRMRRLEGAGGVDPAALEPFDVLVCSHTVMTQSIEELEQVRFATVVLDEAQAIKNPSTQRAKAARRLLASARVALTGTPIENHLGDLYGIMSFLNPGLLGDGQHFERRFAKPIQRDGDAAAREKLRALIAPFLLRRRKSEVLRELPARTEITLRVEPEPAEQAFTEALRRAALERLRAGSATGSAISILAEITRLRRAACHPRLLDKSADVGGAKLDRLVELASELREGGHRALVFSQFVDFLALVRERLDQEGVSYQYLDGSSSEPQRKKAVSAFQRGEGDLFLISLKAGGFGLNLTAADYVIHLDPWWNPAVEAQASDRAHRIGQERPVTIYRLVNAASIEERVLSLHERKRALAEELLRESAEATRLDPASLLALLQDDGR